MIRILVFFLFQLSSIFATSISNEIPNPQYYCTIKKGIDLYTPNTIDKQWIQTSPSETKYNCYPYYTYYYATCNETILSHNTSLVPLYHSGRRFQRLSRRQRLRNQNIPTRPGQYQSISKYINGENSLSPLLFEILCVRDNNSFLNKPYRNHREYRNEYDHRNDYDSKQDAEQDREYDSNGENNNDDTKNQENEYINEEDQNN